MTVSWGKTGQIAHVSSPSSGIAQKTILARHTAEATCELGMGCWLAFALLRGKIINGRRSAVKILPGSKFCAQDRCQICCDELVPSSLG